MQLEVYQYSYIKHTSAQQQHDFINICIHFVQFVHQVIIICMHKKHTHYKGCFRSLTILQLYRQVYTVLAMSYLPSLTQLATQLPSIGRVLGFAAIVCSYALFLCTRNSYIQRPFQLANCCIQVLQLQFVAALVAQKTYISSFKAVFSLNYVYTSFVATVCITYIFCGSQVYVGRNLMSDVATFFLYIHYYTKF